MYLTKLLTNITLTLYALSDVYNIQSYGKVKTYIEHNTPTNPHISIVSGDFISPSKYTNLDGGKLIMDLFQTVPIDIASFGNHEFDIPKHELNSSLDYNKYTTFVSTNIKYITNTYQYYIYQEPKINLTLGFIGLCSSNFYHKYDIQFYTDEEINNTISWVQNNYNPDYIIGLTHATLTDDYIFIDKFPQIDLILGGHIHTFDYSVYKEIPIIRTGENALSLYRIDFYPTKLFEINLIDISEEHVHNDIYQLFLNGEKSFELLNKDPLFYFNSTYYNINPRKKQETLPTLICSLITRYVGSDFTLINSGNFKLKGMEFNKIFSVGNFKEFMPYNDHIVNIRMNKTDLINGIKYSNKYYHGEGGFLQSDINLNNLNELNKFNDIVYVSLTILMIKGVDSNPYFEKYYNTNNYNIKDCEYVQNIIFSYKGNIY